DLEVDATVQGYRKLLEGEKARRQVFTEKAPPEFFGPPPEHVNLRMQALIKQKDGQADEAKQLLLQANEALPLLKGKLNDKPFEGLRDADDRFGSVLEVYAKGKYYWVPLEQVGMIAMNPPKFPRDLIWLPAHLELKEGQAGQVFLPTLYPGTSEEKDFLIKLGRLTDWRGQAVVAGVGL